MGDGKNSVRTKRLLDFLHPTSDDFCPNYPVDKVKVTLTATYQTGKSPCLRASVWGDDDFGFEIEITCTHDNVAQEQRRLTRLLTTELPKAIAIAWLKQNGFVRA